ncbi:theronine dehydrogenase [Vibrio sp. 10N.286.49.C2]|uniref:zinc-dependent alcohol dehydrogenase n=1 Tax=unclassified Vibrio TaxID=2614977 RepID=UPI000C842E0A|nr:MULTISPECIES: zinc-binding dehydrogenase [unclassified Vibrio]PMH26426.1 theronine dehydrogenase [Vibrio sp. 10N.286.49.C2]PMH54850.1 theronine dehydrogenase [Vibrio sp. 10N.286.49.B1]PMH84088.1 theronine dehydrogenase [Vibrio sp. 10N.286.48.B7]
MHIPNKAKVAVLKDIKTIQFMEYPLPSIKDDEILIRIEGCGVCGTDVHEYRNDPFGIMPIVLGHEGTGEIVQIGSKITKDTVGNVVGLGSKIITSIIPCGECEPCVSTPGRTNLCENMGCYGLMGDQPENRFNGWFGEYLVLKSGSTFFNVSDFDLKERILIEPVAVAVHAVERAKTTQLINFASTVLIQGAGPIGLSVIAVLKTLGVQNIIAIDGQESRLKLAKELGATETINFMDYDGTEGIVEKVKSLTNGRGAKFAFQCTGVPSAASTVLKLIERGGGLCEVGFFVDNGETTMNPHLDICNKEITLVGSWAYSPEDYPNAIECMKGIKRIGLPIKKLVTHEYPLSELTEAIETNIRMEGIKVITVN